MIECECEFCIYNKAKKCCLENIELSSNGTCESCIIPEIPRVILDEAKNELIKSYGFIKQEKSTP